MFFKLFILFCFSSVVLMGQSSSVPALRIYKADSTSFYIPLKMIDSLVHFNILLPLIRNLEVKNLTANYVYASADLQSSGGGKLDSTGFCISTFKNPTIEMSNNISKYFDGSKFSTGLTGLQKNTTYYLRAYAANEVGVSYSNQVEFTTLETDDSVMQDIVIGNQVWSNMNLDVAEYRNGDKIRFISNQQEWLDATSRQEGAWCYYNFDSIQGKPYGRLYNWYAVNDKRNISPEGYHVPSDAEWTELANFLGGGDNAGDKLKSSSGWKNDGNGTNSTRFNGLPGGYCNANGGFDQIGEYGYWWSSTADNFAYYRILGFDGGYIARDDIGNDKFEFMSVRCLRD